MNLSSTRIVSGDVGKYAFIAPIELDSQYLIYYVR